jgi:hypothetical protein
MILHNIIDVVEKHWTKYIESLLLSCIKKEHIISDKAEIIKYDVTRRSIDFYIY